MSARLQTLQPQQLQLISYGGLGLLLVALLTYVVLPEWRAYQSTGASLHLLQANVNEGASLEMQLDTMRAEVERMERTLNGDASNLPAKQMEAFVIGRLQTISWRNDVTLVSVTPREGTPLNQFRELVFDVELEGSYFDFFDWLNNIGTELGFVVVKRFDIKAANAPTNGDQAPLRVDLTMAAYRSEQ
ncbi:MAG: type 4a pilus biogenesis protein PilO [Gammaproteobacteria bacterium]